MPLTARSIPLLVMMSLACPAMADVTMPAIFSDNMVLQRDLPVPVWGTAATGEQVIVSFANQSVTTTADANGRWMVKLQPLETSREEASLTVKGQNQIRFNGVLVGEVWLCSGQSNMADSFNPSKNRFIEPSFFETDLSRLRVATRTGWSNVTEKTQRSISRVGFYFGAKLYRELDVPIGLVLRYNSGTPIQAWMPMEASEVIRDRLGIPADWNDEQDNRNPAVQYNDKIAPIVPYAMRGVIWYQGERNAKASTGWEYRHLLPFHIQTWRERWATTAGLPERTFPFYYVQVPTQEIPKARSNNSSEWPWLRDAMRRALDTTENTGMAVFYDHGPSLHPDNKRPAGERLALWALAKDYGRDNIVYSGPLLKDATFADGQATLTFRHVGGGLKNMTGKETLDFFEIASSDGKYVPAVARIVNDTVVVHHESVSEPAFVRYLFRKPNPDPTVSLVNAEGLPASPFMTDDFKPPRE